jgi:hypothetical protein
VAITYEAVGALPIEAPTPIFTEDRCEFALFERVIVLLGASAVGLASGFTLSVFMGRHGMWEAVFGSVPALIVALYFASATVNDAINRGATACAAIALVAVGTLLAWPFMISMGTDIYWIAPVTAMAALLVLAFSWRGSSGAVYAIGGQGALVAALTAHQGLQLLVAN